MQDCLFCKIMAGEIPSKKVYEDEDTYAFYDIAPQAPVHVLVVSKHHTPDVAHNADLTDHQLAACLRPRSLGWKRAATVSSITVVKTPARRSSIFTSTFWAVKSWPSAWPEVWLLKKSMTPFLSKWIETGSCCF